MKAIELKFLLKLLGSPEYRTAISQLKPSEKTPTSERDRICRELSDRGIVSYSREVKQFKIEPAGKALLTQDTIELPLTEQQLMVLKACATESAAPGKLDKIPVGDRQTIIQDLEAKGFIKATKSNIKEVWLTDQGREYLRDEYQPSSKGNLTLSSSQFQNYLHFMRKQMQRGVSEGELPAPPKSPKSHERPAPPSDEDILQIIQDLDQEFSTDNYLPIFRLRERLPSFSRDQLDQALYRLQQQDKIELSTLQEGKRYTSEQIDAGIPQPVGGPLFFIVVL